MQPRRYTTYERDSNGGDEAMFRRYESKLTRFSQPDPYDGSYDFSDQQSLNRYSYTENDPVNFSDPSGLQTCWGAQCGWNDVANGFFGWGNIIDRPRNTGREIIHQSEENNLSLDVIVNLSHDAVDSRPVNSSVGRLLNLVEF